MGLHVGRHVGRQTNAPAISPQDEKGWRNWADHKAKKRAETVWHELECRVCGRPFRSRLADTPECSSCVEAFCE